jgi:hypothetical protein
MLQSKYYAIVVSFSARLELAKGRAKLAGGLASSSNLDSQDPPLSVHLEATKRRAVEAWGGA